MVFVEDKDQKVRTDKTETRSCICGGLGQKYHIIQSSAGETDWCI